MRVLLFSDVDSEVTRRLIDATLRHAGEKGTEVAGVVISRPSRLALRGSRARRVARQALIAACNRDIPLRASFERSTGMVELLRRRRVPVLVPPEGDPNDPAFLDRLREVDADVALSYYSLRIFRRPLLESFRHAVNFHNGALPHYKGLMATSFAIYDGESHAGYTFHHMTEELDGGPVLVQGSVTIGARDGLGAVTTMLARRAAADVPRVLEMIAAGDPGRPQVGAGSYFGRREVDALIRVHDPTRLSADELQRRVRAFGKIDVTIGGVEYPVTRLRSTSRARPLAFRTVDGSLLVPDRLGELPAALRHLRRIRGRG